VQWSSWAFPGLSVNPPAFQKLSRTVEEFAIGHRVITRWQSKKLEASLNNPVLGRRADHDKPVRILLNGNQFVSGKMLEMASIRVLVVDDHEVARRSVRSVLAADPDLEIAAEVPDGEQAIRKAQDIHPDVVLLDIGLPGMSGIDAARRIRSVSPESRIIFLSQHDSIFVAKDALRAGASAYVVKSDAGRDLLTAVTAALEGRAFVSQTLMARGWK
jgi:CheY-like chemotaxis protein